jgi:uncharacterized protein YggL (DUF469 family)
LFLGDKIGKINYEIEYENYDIIFNDFINFLKNDEMGGGGGYKTFSKLIVNSLYGRLCTQEDDSVFLFIKKKLTRRV